MMDLNELRLWVGKRIREARERTGMTQTKFASLLDASQGDLGRWERGEVLPRITVLFRVAQIADVDLNWFDPAHHGEAERDWRPVVARYLELVAESLRSSAEGEAEGVLRDLEEADLERLRARMQGSEGPGSPISSPSGQ